MCESGNLRSLCVAGVPGFEPGHAGIKTQCLTAWRHPNKLYLSSMFERWMGLSEQVRILQRFNKFVNGVIKKKVTSHVIPSEARDLSAVISETYARFGSLT